MPGENNNNNIDNLNQSGSSDQKMNSEKQLPQLYKAQRGDSPKNDSSNGGMKQAAKNAAVDKGVDVAAEAAGNAIAPGVGGKVGKALAKSPIGKAVKNKIANQGGDKLKAMPGMPLKKPGVVKAGQSLNNALKDDPKQNQNQQMQGQQKQAQQGVGEQGGNSEEEQSESSFSRFNPFNKNKKKQQGSTPTDSDGSDDGKDKGKASIEGIFKITPLKIAIIAGVIGFAFLLLFFILISLVTTEGLFEATLITNQETDGGEKADEEFDIDDKDMEEFVERVKRVKEKHTDDGVKVDTSYITGVFSVINQYNDKFNIDNMTTSVIEDIVDAHNTQEDEQRRAKLLRIFKHHTKQKFSDADLDDIIDEIDEYIEDYYDLIDAEKVNMSMCGPLGSCIYEIKGFYINGKGNKEKNITISNLKVRLMQAGQVGSYGHCGGTYGQPIEGEELVDFEKYILGVAYAEIGEGSAGNLEPQKAQMVAARSYILARAEDMGSSHGNKLVQENGQWILQVTNCVSDQVYCDPDRGCSKKVAKNNQYGNVYSGVDNPITYKGPLDQNAPIRQAVAETAGEVLVNSQGNIIYAGFLQSDQTAFSNMAKEGKSYTEILISRYNSSSRPYGATDIQKMNCSGGSDSCEVPGASGDFTNWKQYDPTWGSITLGTSSLTIKSAGCLVTSVAIQIARSNVVTTVDGEFNPGTFTQKLNTTGGFSGALYNWGAESKAAPNFKHAGTVKLSGKSDDKKREELQKLLDQGYYVIAEVKGGTSSSMHWVAIDKIEGNAIKMMDPGSSKVDMWATYTSAKTSRYEYFKVG